MVCREQFACTALARRRKRRNLGLLPTIATKHRAEYANQATEEPFHSANNTKGTVREANRCTRYGLTPKSPLRWCRAAHSTRVQCTLQTTSQEWMSTNREPPCSSSDTCAA